MIINDDDRSSLIDCRINQAKQTIETVNFLIENNQYILAVNRVYYGMYYALSALAIKHQFETSKHAQLIGWFNKEFVNNNKVTVETGWILRKAFNNRTRGDYDAFVSFEKEEVELMYLELKQFIDAINISLQK